MARTNPDALTEEILRQAEQFSVMTRSAYEQGYKRGYAQGRLEAATEANQIVKDCIKEVAQS